MDRRGFVAVVDRRALGWRMRGRQPHTVICIAAVERIALAVSTVAVESAAAALNIAIGQRIVAEVLDVVASTVVAQRVDFEGHTVAVALVAGHIAAVVHVGVADRTVAAAHIEDAVRTAAVDDGVVDRIVAVAHIVAAVLNNAALVHNATVAVVHTAPAPTIHTGVHCHTQVVQEEKTHIDWRHSHCSYHDDVASSYPASHVHLPDDERPHRSAAANDALTCYAPQHAPDAQSVCSDAYRCRDPCQTLNCVGH